MKHVTKRNQSGNYNYRGYNICTKGIRNWVTEKYGPPVWVARNIETGVELPYAETLKSAKEYVDEWHGKGGA